MQLLRAAAPPLSRLPAMGSDHGDHIHYEEVALDEMEWVEEDGMYYYQCPCGDMFEISQEDIEKGEDVARCPSCSLTLKVIMPAAGDVSHDARTDHGHRGGLSIIASTTILGTR